MSDKIRIVIIDDKKNITDVLVSILNENCSEDVEIAGVAHSVVNGVDCINSCKPELIFLDIELPDGSGFDILNKIEDNEAAVVFITGHNDYAIKAFEFSAIHYILKPFDSGQIIEAVSRYKSYQKKDLQKQLELMAYNFSKNDKRIALPTKKEIEVVDIKDVIYIESVGNYLIFYMDGSKEVVVVKSMNYYENLLINYGFFRIHNKYLINFQHMNRYIRGRGGYVKLCNGVELEVSSRRKQAFLSKLDKVGI